MPSLRKPQAITEQNIGMRPSLGTMKCAIATVAIGENHQSAYATIFKTVSGALCRAVRI